MLKCIAVADVRVGMYIHEFCGSWMDHPFWKSKFLLESEKDLLRVKSSSVTQLWIDVSKGLDVEAGIVSASAEEMAAQADETLMAVVQSPRVIKAASMDDELQRAVKLVANAKQAVISMFSDARMGQALQFEQAGALVEDISDSVLRHPHALLSLMRLKNADEYTYMHSVAVCGLMIALARQMGLDDMQVREAGFAGLLHDIGKMAIPNEILNKPDKLTDGEFATMRDHPVAGSRMLLESKKVGAMALDVCLHHHEKIDGTGYPHGLSGEQISLFARMGAVCDVYDAITSDRVYRKGWDPGESIRKMAEWKGHFDPLVFQAFVKAVGIYPVGSLVRLESGRIAVVMEQQTGSLLTPVVKVFFCAKTKTPIAREVLDLSKLVGRDKIIGRVSPEQWGFRNTDELWSGLPG